MFHGNVGAEKRFQEWFSTTCRRHKKALISLGVYKSGDVGTHSIRKGSSTYLNSFPSGPTEVSSFLHAGWSRGAVRSRYIFAGEGSDQLCGRLAAGLCINDRTFSCLPPHFVESPLTDSEWMTVLPTYETYFPTCFRAVLPYLLASIAYHDDWLREHLPEGHWLFNSRLYSDGGARVAMLAQRVQTGFARNDTSGMTATGVPSTLVLRDEVVTLHEIVETGFTQVLQRIEAIPDLLKEAMLRNFAINGCVPLTRSDLDTVCQSLTSTVVAAVQSVTAVIGGAAGRHDGYANSETVLRETTSNANQEISRTGQNDTWRTWQYDDGLEYYVPQTFDFRRRKSVDALLRLWFNGDGEVRPYRLLRKRDIRPQASRVHYSKATTVVNSFMNFIVATNTGVTTVEDVICMTSAQRDQLFQQHMWPWLQQVTGRTRLSLSKSLYGESSFVTVYGEILRRRREAPVAVGTESRVLDAAVQRTGVNVFDPMEILRSSQERVQFGGDLRSRRSRRSSEYLEGQDRTAVQILTQQLQHVWNGDAIPTEFIAATMQAAREWRDRTAARESQEDVGEPIARSEG